MKISIAFLIAFALFPDPAWAQNPPAGSFINRTPAPATCQPGSVFQAGTGARTYYTCPAGTPVGIGASGGVTSVQTLTGAVALFTTNAKTSTYQVLAADFTACKTIPVASGTFTITLVASGAQPASGQCVKVINYGSGVVTIARSGQNINGGTASLTLAAASATAPTEAFIVSDGTNYFGSLASAGGCAASTPQVCFGPTGAGSNGLLYNSSATQLIVGPNASSFVADDPINDAPGSTLLPFVVYGKPTIATNYDYYLSAIQLYPVLGTGSYVDGLDFRIQPSSGTNAYLDGIRVLVNAGATTTPQTVRAMTLGNTGGTLSKAIEMAASASTSGTAYGGHITSVIADGGTAYGWSIQNVGFGGDPTLGIGLDIGDVAGTTKLAIRTGVGKVQHADVLLLSGDVVNPFQTVKNTQSATAPGAGIADLRWIAGTNAGTCKLVGAAGTSATEVTIIDNVGGGC